MRYRFGIRYYKMNGRWVTYLKLLDYRLERIADKLHKRSDASLKRTRMGKYYRRFCRYLVGKSVGYLDVFVILSVEMKYFFKQFYGILLIEQIFIRWIMSLVDVYVK